MGKRKIIDLIDDGWETMQKGIKKVKMILEGHTDEEISSEEYMNLYTTVYNMCTGQTAVDNTGSGKPDPQQQQLYNMYKETIADYIHSKITPSLRNKHDEFLLRELVKGWTNHKIMVRWLRRIFLYLDRYFPRKNRLPKLEDVGLAGFHDLIYREFRNNIAHASIALIDQEREGMLIDRALLKGAVDLYVEIGKVKIDFYENDFEKAMLDATDAYYSRKASAWILVDSLPDYMRKVEECLKNEKDRVSNYLDSSSETELLEKVRNQLLVAHSNQLLEKAYSGCCVLLRDYKLEDLSRMYRLFQSIRGGLEHVAKIFKQHVASEGMVLFKEAEDAMSSNKAEKKMGGAEDMGLATKVTELHEKYLGYVCGCFSENTLFHKALREAFEAFCNKVAGGTSSAEILALYCDDILKKGGAGKLSDEATEETLDKVAKILAYISDKDLFAEFYRKKLSRRLLIERSANNEHERYILTRLKQQCGSHFTSKMEGMVNDLILAKENQNQFQEYISNNYTANLGMELTVTILTTGLWPNYKSSDLSLPAEMAKCVQVFNEFYQAKTNRRRLNWNYSLGTCNINAKFEQKTIELVVVTYQAAVLLLFNNADKLSYSDIKTQLNLGDDDLVRVLHSISCAKYKILNKEPDTKSVSQDDSFLFNHKFTEKMRRIRIPLPPVDERKKVVRSVEKDRHYNIDAAVVRTMKSRKVLGYQQLITECVEQLSHMFKPDVKEIKKRIEDLIAREYLERDQFKPNLFRYLA